MEARGVTWRVVVYEARAVMADAGLPVPDGRVIHAEYQAAAGEEAAMELLARGPGPTAIVAADAPLGLGPWHALAARGVSVPADVSLIAIHRLPFEEYRVPAVTCVLLPLRALGGRAAELVLDTPPDAPIHELITEGVELPEGDTTAPPRAASRQAASRHGPTHPRLVP